MANRFVFCGLDSEEDLNLIVNDVHQYIGPNITENVQEVPGMYGSIFQGNSYGERQIDIDVTIATDTESEREQILHNLADLFVQTGVGEFPLVFTDDSEFTYYGHFSALPAPQRVQNGVSDETVTLTFMCSDPQCYGLQQTINIAQNPFTYTPDGGGECFPVFTCIPSHDVTKIAVADQDGNYVYVGEDVDPDTQSSPVDNYPLVINDACNSFGTGWNMLSGTAVPTWLENDVVTSGANFQSTHDVFKIENDKSFGSGSSNHWHGAYMIRTFPAAYGDWRITIRMYNDQSYPRAKGKIELYLLDSGGNRIGCIYLKDNGNGEDVICCIEIGTHTGSKDNRHNVIYTRGKVNDKKKKYVKIKYKDGTKKVKVNGKTKTETRWKTSYLESQPDTDSFTDFFGTLQLQKIGNKFSAYIMKLDSETHHPMWSKPITAVFTDTTKQYNKSLAGVGLFIGKYDTTEDNHGIGYANNRMGLTDLKVNNIQNGGVNPNDVPIIIAHAGDEIKIDCEDGQIYKNSAPFMNHLFIGSNFPVMKGGTMSTYGFEPSTDEATWTIDYRPTHK